MPRRTGGVPCRRKKACHLLSCLDAVCVQRTRCKRTHQVRLPEQVRACLCQPDDLRGLPHWLCVPPCSHQDGNNFYQSCALITPGPGEFDAGGKLQWHRRPAPACSPSHGARAASCLAVGRQHSMGQDMRTFRPRFNNRGFGSGDRPCMKEQPETSPGPGAYDLSGSAVYGA